MLVFPVLGDGSISSVASTKCSYPFRLVSYRDATPHVCHHSRVSFTNKAGQVLVGDKDNN